VGDGRRWRRWMAVRTKLIDDFFHRRGAAGGIRQGGDPGRQGSTQRAYRLGWGRRGTDGVRGSTNQMSSSSKRATLQDHRRHSDRSAPNGWAIDSAPRTGPAALHDAGFLMRRSQRRGAPGLPTGVFSCAQTLRIGLLGQTIPPLSGVSGSRLVAKRKHGRWVVAKKE